MAEIFSLRHAFFIFLRIRSLRHSSHALKCGDFWLYSVKKLFVDLHEGLKGAIKGEENDKKFIAEKFTKVLEESFKELVIYEDNKRKVRLELLENFKGIRTKKGRIFSRSADLILKTREETIVIEVKTLLEFNSFGAAYLEALISEWDTFFIFSIAGSDSNYKIFRDMLKELAKNRSCYTGGKKYADIAIFDSNIEGFQEGIENFFKILNEEHTNN